MDGAAFTKRFREETMDEAEPFFWADGLVLRYLDEAQVEFCRRTEGIEDSTSSLCTLQVPAGAGTAKLSPKILKVRAAVLDSPSRRLDLLSVEDARRTPTVGHGVPRALVIGRGSVQLMPTPTEPCVIRLDVFRLPLAAVEAPGDEAEVDDRHAPTLMHYALYRAYSRPDPDTMDRVKADYFRQLFDAGCAEARKEQGRVRKPNGAAMFSW